MTPLRAVDDIEIGDPGPVTRAIQAAYLDTVKGKRPEYDAWLDYVPGRKRA